MQLLENRIDQKIAMDLIANGKVVGMSAKRPIAVPGVHIEDAGPATAEAFLGFDEVVRKKTAREKAHKKVMTHKNRDHLRIREIRLLLDETQGEFAGALSIRTPTLVSYEQGQTKMVPSAIMERAEMLLAEGLAEINALRERFDHRSMLEILDDWAKLLNIQSSDLATMAAMTETVPSTVCRWRSGECRPSLRELRKYDLAVRMNVARNRKVAVAG